MFGCNKGAFLGSLWIQQLMLVWSFPFFLTVQDALISARFNMSNRHHHSLYAAPCQPDWFIGQAQAAERVGGGGGGREEQTEIWNETEMEAEQTVGPSGIYDACGRTINANVPNWASRRILGNLFSPFLEREKDPPCLFISTSSDLRKSAFNQRKSTNAFAKSEAIAPCFVV